MANLQTASNFAVFGSVILAISTVLVTKGISNVWTYVLFIGSLLIILGTILIIVINIFYPYLEVSIGNSKTLWWLLNQIGIVFVLLGLLLAFIGIIVIVYMIWNGEISV